MRARTTPCKTLTHDHSWGLGCILPRVPAIIDRVGREAERARSILRDTERAKRKIKRAYRIDCPQCDGTGKIHMDDQKRILRQIDEKLNVDQVSSGNNTIAC